ncbi:response regulator [Microseira wollei]|uniref:Two-component hybrid sensor and regulator n=1 Tax=Microseira wollei NIES-4236 TaxID=2530354 RepID=A0AAV3XE62_9CYAN|nr:response regulator [Microseira wollei]GET41222.1 two-component hybrid sensor and regulator [Microseira wollei NIES-4236]
MKKILVIEDDADQRIMISLFLRSENFQVTLAENGRVGLELARKIKPDLIVCDIHMPELNGYEVLKALRDDMATANIPFIFLTAEVDADAHCRAIGLGADDYLTKPTDLKHLLLAIAIHLKTISDQNPPTCGSEYDDSYFSLPSWRNVTYC